MFFHSDKLIPLMKNTGLESWISGNVAIPCDSLIQNIFSWSDSGAKVVVFCLFFLTYFLLKTCARFNLTPSSVRCYLTDGKVTWWFSGSRVRNATEKSWLIFPAPHIPQRVAIGLVTCDCPLLAARTISGKCCDLSCFRAKRLRQAPASPMGGAFWAICSNTRG